MAESTDNAAKRPASAASKYPEFSQAQRRALAILQDNLPDSATPFADIAAEVGLAEAEVLELVRWLKEAGVIRRFGATLRHQKAGYGHNAMVAWFVEDEERILEFGRIMAERPEVSHCYWRATCMDWPYHLYTMIHGREPGECMRVAAEIAEVIGQLGVVQYDALESLTELKKTSMRYFVDQTPAGQTPAGQTPAGKRGGDPSDSNP